MSPKRLTRSAALGLALAAFAAPSTANAQDLRSPDARSDAPALPAAHDLRSPDARTATLSPQGSTGDLRSPDTRDLALGRGTADAPAVMVVKVREPAAAPAPVSDGIDWGDAGIGAAVLLGMGGLALGGAYAAAHRRGPGLRTG
jgi:hypothetical protein